jgi:hypothetical protein
MWDKVECLFVSRMHLLSRILGLVRYGYVECVSYKGEVGDAVTIFPRLRIQATCHLPCGQGKA